MSRLRAAAHRSKKLLPGLATSSLVLSEVKARDCYCHFKLLIRNSMIAWEILEWFKSGWLSPATEFWNALFHSYESKRFHRSAIGLDSRGIELGITVFWDKKKDPLTLALSPT